MSYRVIICFTRRDCMETEHIVILSIVIGAFLALIIYSIIHSHNRKIVMTYSDLYAQIQRLNAQYKFEELEAELFFSNQCKSKRGLENFDFDKNMQSIIEQNIPYYQRLLNKIDTNRELWAEYTRKYSLIENYTNKDELQAMKLKIPYKVFFRHEKALYSKSMLPVPTRSISIQYHASYTSPAGRNSYSCSKNYSNVDIKKFINKIVEQRAEQLRKEAEKRQKEIEREEIRRQKIATAKQNEKKQKELLQREESLSQREKEFQDATQGHIYSVQYTTTVEQQVQDDETVSTWVKMKRLKLLYDNGEITYAEYEKRRKELL